MNSPRVSVLLSAYNPRYLRQSLDSIVAQTFDDFEFVIVDDSIAESTQAILAEVAARDRRIVLSRNARNLGQVRSLNVGLGLARGVYLARQDDDDISLPGRLAEQVAFLEAHPEIGLVGTQVDILDADGALLDGRHFFYPETKPEAIPAQLLQDNCLCHGSVMIRRACLEPMGGYDESLAPAEDYDLWLRLSEVTGVTRLETHLYQFRYYAESVSERRNPKQLLNKAVALDQAIQRRFGPAPPAARRLPAARHYLRAAVSNFAAGDLPATRRGLARALTLGPELFDSPDTYLPVPATEAGLAFAETVFADLPSTPQMARLAARLRARLHMRQVFEGAGQGDLGRVEAHVWRGVRADPRWLLNRGVISLAARSSLRRAGAMLGRKPNHSENKRGDST